MRYLHTALASLAATLSAVSASADVVVLEPSKDNSMYSENGSLSNGAGDHIFSGTTIMGNVRRALLAFDVAGAIPAGATINSVSLQMHNSMTIAGNADISLHVASADWGEESSDAPGQEGAGTVGAPGDATWTDNFLSASTWTTPGGDFNPTPSATATVGGSFQFYTWTSATLASDVQSMLDNPGMNFGWVLRNDNEAAQPSAKRFDSRTNPNATFRPMLTVDFDPPSGCVSSNFCSTSPNSVGAGAIISFTGSCVVADNALTLTATPVPNQPGIFFYGQGTVNGGMGQPFGNGIRCVGGGQIFRLPVSFASGGTLSFTPDLTMPPGAAGLITAGSTWNFQAWYRDPAGGGAGFNLSDGLELTFQ